jgi:hypothetical protein
MRCREGDGLGCSCRAVAFCLSGLACTGAATAAQPLAAQSSAAHSASGAPNASGYVLPSAVGSSSFPPLPAAPLPAESRLVRLNHQQYRHTVRDLFGVQDSPELVFAPDALGGFLFETDNALLVDGRLGPQYRSAAEALAERAVSDTAIYARIVPCPAAAPGCREQFLRSFGERAFRRPPSERDLDTFRGLFASGAARFASGDEFKDGVRLTVEALLQAPDFLYRSVAGAPGADGRVQLDDFDVAARLSYFLYDSMPDAGLFAAAHAGRLHTPDEVEAAARRMLREPRVLPQLASFHEQVWGFGRFAGISPDPEKYPQLPGGFVWRVRRAARLFLRDVLMSGGGLEELLTAPYVYADEGLAPLYGATAPLDARAGVDPTGRFARLELPPGEREGFLMQIGYLASNAYSASTDPIHRGLFVIRNLLCRAVPDPPPGATLTPLPATHPPIVTTRDEVSVLTGQSFCPTCHAQINAPGYAFEGFDAIGQKRATDNGAPVDTSGSMVLDGQMLIFNGPTALIEGIARSREAHRCYSRRWLEFALGRPLAQSDLPTLDAIASESRPLAELLVAIARSPEFLTLPPSAAPGGSP